MNIFSDFNERIRALIEALGINAKDGGSLDLSRVSVEPPRDPAHGDLATNAAMMLAKPAGQPPRVLAERLAAALNADPDAEGGEAGGPRLVHFPPAPWLLPA